MEHRVLVYTRTPLDEYTDSLSNSIHLALSEDGAPFEPLNQNYGIVFPEATLSEHNTILEKGAKNPFLFRTEEGGFGLVAVRVAPQGAQDEESRGCVLVWTSTDLTEFRSLGLLRLHNYLHVDAVECRYDETAGEYEFLWRDADGNVYVNQVVDLAGGGSKGPRPASGSPQVPQVPHPSNLTDVNPGNVLAVEPSIAQAVRDRWTPLTHTETRVPKTVVASSPSDLAAVKATAVYSDGSTADKSVAWDTSAVDFSAPGTYRATGKVQTPVHPYPLARGYADPVILPWEGKYYFIATNDNVGDIGFYVRESETINGLFDDGFREQVILDVDESRGFVQTFWAPEFHRIGDDLYILFAVSGTEWGPQCYMMRLKKGHDIMRADSWETPVRVRKADGSHLAESGTITLDMTYFEADGRSFLLWSSRTGLGSPMDTGSMVCIAETTAADPTRLISEPVVLTRPLYGWENVHGTINNEGPYPLLTDETVYITYSGGAARGYTYSIGLLSIPRGGDYLDAAAWSKAITPIVNYRSVEGLYGAGHNSLFTDYDGNTWICYHAVAAPVIHEVVSSAMHRVHFGKKGVPVFNLSPARDLRADLTDVLLDVVVP
ncbi:MULTISPECIES: family 43 glycosylhydrolase [unclassified Saccharothrix]|uniref:family 43 glycosylhydrolase n=1 Tax=unclassified Saccharothrix TaxID=2593673 RepID=UPI00307D0896